jgi:hypothetical protein
MPSFLCCINVEKAKQHGNKLHSRTDINISLQSYSNKTPCYNFTYHICRLVEKEVDTNEAQSIFDEIKYTLKRTNTLQECLRIIASSLENISRQAPVNES